MLTNQGCHTGLDLQFVLFIGPLFPQFSVRVGQKWVSCLSDPERERNPVDRCIAARKNSRHLLRLTVMMLTLSGPGGTAPTRTSPWGGLAGHLVRTPKPSTAFTSISLHSVCGLWKSLNPSLHNEPQSCWKWTRHCENTRPCSPTFIKALTGLTRGVLALLCSLTVAATYALYIWNKSHCLLSASASFR